MTLFLFLIINTTIALDLKVYNLNTLCDFCEKDNLDSFSKRAQFIKQSIKRHKPDLISLQELRVSSLLKKILPKGYDIYNFENIFLSYADPTIAYKKDKFHMISKGYFWLGPKDSFNFGWKLSLPRLTLWVKLKEVTSKREFYFIATHFDNRNANLLGSSKKVNQFIKNLDHLPLILAGDTNLPTHHPPYKDLTNGILENTFNKSQAINFIANKSHKDSDRCYIHKGSKFPQCRVEHILIDNRSNWFVKSWELDMTRYGEKMRFNSDHRPVIVQLSLQP